MVALLLLLSVPATPQTVRSIRLYSEMQRIGPMGEWVQADRGANQTTPPREILSPGVPRNGHLSLQVAITADPKTTYFLAVQSNPENVFQWKLFKAGFERLNGHWVPNRLTEDRDPFFNVAPDSDVNIPGQTTQVFVLDAFVPENTPVSRIRLEVLVKSDTWRVSPMEVRILEPKLRPPPSGAPAPATLAAIVKRNRAQVEAFASTLDDTIRERCFAFRSQQDMLGAEWFLKSRDCLFAASKPQNP